MTISIVGRQSHRLSSPTPFIHGIIEGKGGIRHAEKSPKLRYCRVIAWNWPLTMEWSGVVDLSDLVGKGVFALWSDHHAFEQVRIGSFGELAWGDQIDLCPDSLYLKVTGKNPEEVFPALCAARPPVLRSAASSESLSRCSSTINNPTAFHD